MKKLLTLILSMAILVSMLSGCGNGTSGSGSTAGDTKAPSGSETKASSAENPSQEADAGNGEVVTINLYTMSMGPNKDYKDVESKINEISEKEIGVRINWTMLDIGQWFQQYSMLISGGEQIDIIPSLGQFTASASQSAFLEMDDLLESYGQGIKAVYAEVDPDYMLSGYVNGKLYGLGPCHDFGAGKAIFYVKDIVDELGLDVSHVKTLEDWTEILEAVHEAKPEIAPFVSSSGSTANNLAQCDWDPAGNNYGVLLNGGETLEPVNLYETEEYESYVRLFREWFNSGLIAKDTATSTENFETLMSAGTAFSTWHVWNPGSETEMKLKIGKDIGTIQIVEPYAVAGNNLMWSIPVTSKNPEAAMKFLNLMYTNADIINLFNYGIEDVHYQIKEEGVFGYPEGQDITTSGYHPNMEWVWPNSYNGAQWEGSLPGLGDSMKDFGKNAKKSKAMGFVFNAEPVINEITACDNVIKEYAYALETGAVDPDETLPKFREALQKAGIDKIIAEKQKQLNEWSAAKK